MKIDCGISSNSVSGPDSKITFRKAESEERASLALGPILSPPDTLMWLELIFLVFPI